MAQTLARPIPWVNFFFFSMTGKQCKHSNLNSFSTYHLWQVDFKQTSALSQLQFTLKSHFSNTLLGPYYRGPLGSIARKNM